jgi:hypothetical protein
VGGTATLHNLLRTTEDNYGVAHSGSAARVRSIVGPFKTDAPFTIRSFQQGVAEYTATTDTFIDEANPNSAHGGDTVLTIGGSPSNQALLRFDNLLGGGAGQVPAGAQILSAKLVLTTNQTEFYSADQTVSLHRLLVPFNGSSSWNNLSDGIALGSEAQATPEFTLFPNIDGHRAIFDVSDWAQSISDGSVNYGWLVNSVGPAHWMIESADSADVDLRPRLEITFRGALRGDFNLDGALTAADIQAMLAALTDLPAYRADHNNLPQADLLAIGDFTGDGNVTNADIQPLLNLLAAGGGSATSVPEPAGFPMAIFGAAVFWIRRHDHSPW